MTVTDVKFNSDGLIPSIAQDALTGEVLMLAYMNSESLEKTLSTGRAHYYSRSRQELWEKGATSGHYQYVRSVSLDCDMDAVLLLVEQQGSACHTGAKNCFFNVIQGEDIYHEFGILKSLYELVNDRMENPKEGSYTNFLLSKGIDKIAKKVGEEAVEVVIASKNDSAEDIVNETADLLYHLVVLLAQKGVPIEDVLKELVKRH